MVRGADFAKASREAKFLKMSFAKKTDFGKK